MKNKEKKGFSTYEIFVIAVLAILQFTVVLDFMVISPLGAQLLTELNIGTDEFSIVVSAYALSAGISGIMAAGFADRFDRKKLLLFFYAGFIGGTLLCGIAPYYYFLLGARIVTGIFGGVLGSIGFAIITDLFTMEVRGRVMGFTQMSFAACQVFGLPLSLYLANNWGWHFPFIFIVTVSAVTSAAIFFFMKPVDQHLHLARNINPLHHLGGILKNGRYWKGFAATALLATGGWMLMPFGSAFAVNNLGLKLEDLDFFYLMTGIFTLGAGPIAGRLSDKVGKYKTFIFGSILSTIIVNIYCNLDETPMVWVITLNVILFVGIMSRMVPASAMMTAIPEMKDRGAFMGINASIQQLSGGVASMIAGLIVYQDKQGFIHNYDVLGYVVSGAIVITVVMMYVINKMITEPAQEPSVPAEV